MSDCELVFRQLDRDLLHVRVNRAETCLGPHPTNDVVVPDASLPDVAAVLIDHGAQRFHLRSLAGDRITVNSRRIEDDDVALTDGDEIKVGTYTLTFRVRQGSDFSGSGRTKIQPEESKEERSALMNYAGNEYKVPVTGPYNIGSDPNNDLVINDDFISSFHCRVSCRDGRWTLTDLASTNGTEVNGLKVGETELPERATIQLGGNASIEFSQQTHKKSLKFQNHYGMLAASAEMNHVFGLINKFSSVDAPVLITGNSGCGKELVAQALHSASTRAQKPYLAINCGALAASIIEAELFGHVKGAFTGAMSDKKGAFEAVQGGTLFLDEIGEMPLDLQPKLLRVLESKTVRPVGGTSEIQVDTRIVAATHRDLKELVRQGKFREDLFHRLYVLSIRIPSLAERPDDILILAETFLKQQTPEREFSLSSKAQDRLTSYSWPGNIRELKNMMLRAALLTDHDVIDDVDLEFSENTFFTKTASQRVRKVDDDERGQIIRILKENGGNRAQAARVLGFSKSTFHDKLKRLGVPNKFS